MLLQKNSKPKRSEMTVTERKVGFKIKMKDAMRNKNIIRVRRGAGQARYCACDNAGNPIKGFDKLLDIRRYWKKEIKQGYIELVRELDKKPEMGAINDIIKSIETILKSSR